MDFLNSFIGENYSLKFDTLVKKIIDNSTDKLDDEQILERIITLVNINFLGVRINGTPIMYAFNIQESGKLNSIIKNKSNNKKLTFEIHPVFHKHLNISNEVCTSLLDRLYFSLKGKLKV